MFYFGFQESGSDVWVVALEDIGTVLGPRTVSAQWSLSSFNLKPLPKGLTLAQAS